MNKNIMKKSILTFLLMIFISIGFVSCDQVTSGPSISNNSNSNTIRDNDEVWVEQLEIIQMPNRLSYIPDEEVFDSTGMILKAIWSDGYVEENISSNKYYVEPSGILPIGTTYVTIHYGDATVKLDISTTGEYELCIIQMPVKTDYNVGEYFDPNGLVLGLKLNNIIKEFRDYKVEDVIFEKRALTLNDKYVTVNYNNLSINVPIKCFSNTLKIELEDQKYVEMTNCKPKNQVTKMDDGTYRFGNSDVVYNSYEDAYANHTESAKCQLENASNKDFLANINDSKATFTVKFTPNFENANLRIRGASNAVGKYDKSSKPTKSLDMDLTKVMNIELNGEKLTIDSNAILKGITSSEPSDYVWTNWHTAFLGNIKLKANAVNTIKFTFKVYSEYVHPWGSALGQYDYLLLEQI